MLRRLETLKDSAEATFDSATARVENCHRLIGGYFRARLRSGTKGAQDRDDPPIATSIYDVIRGVNREIGEFGTDMFEIIDDARARRRAEKRRGVDRDASDDNDIQP